MNSNEKRWIVLLIAVVLIAVILIVALVNANGKEDENLGNPNNGETSQNVQDEEKYTAELSDGTKINTSEDFNKTKTYGDLEITNIQFTNKNGMTVLLADVTNKGTNTHEEEIVTIKILGENGEVLDELHPSLGRIEPGETIELNAGTSADVANAKDFTIEASK